MTARTDHVTSFLYAIYVHAAPEQVWRGLTDPAVTAQYWRHPQAGPKTFRSDWKAGSTYELAHEDVGLVVKLTATHAGFPPELGPQHRGRGGPPGLSASPGAARAARRAPSGAPGTERRLPRPRLDGRTRR